MYVRTKEHIANNKKSILEGYRTGKRIPVFLGEKRPDFSLWLKKAYASGLKKVISMKGEKNKAWRGEKAGYSALHKWMYGNFGAPQSCEMCITGKGKRFEWANISGKYKRERSDWLRLCSKCHKDYDKAPPKFCSCGLAYFAKGMCIKCYYQNRYKTLIKK